MPRTGSKTEISPLHPIERAFVVVSVMYSFLYFFWRWKVSLDPTLHPVYSMAYFFADAFGFVSSLFFLIATWKIQKRKPPVLIHSPSVDVFIPTINEDPELLRVTVNHAKRMDYERKSIWILDDGRRPAVEALAREMEVGYLSRPSNRGAKAGNLNDALKRTSGEIIALFDADGIPRKDFLAAVLGYFENPKIAIVQTPNAFYNLDSFQHWSENTGTRAWHDQALWYDVIQRGLDTRNAATWCGSGSAIRRSAIEEIGGIPEDSVTEDTLTSLKLHELGFETHYHDEPVAFSLAPATIEPFLVQRGRWAMGSIQILRRKWATILFSGKLNLHQRCAYLMTLYYFTVIQKIFYYTAPLAYLCFGVSPVVEPERMVIPLLIYVILSTTTFQILSRGSGRIVRGEIHFMHLIPVYLKAIALGLLPGYRGRFRVTPKGRSGKLSWKVWATPFFFTAITLVPFLMGIQTYLTREGGGAGLALAIAIAGYYLVVSLGCLFTVVKKPREEGVNSFFDHRPVRIRGAGAVDGAFGVTLMLSESSFQVLHKEPLKAGGRLSLELSLPEAELLLTGSLESSIAWTAEGAVPMQVSRVRLDPMELGAREELHVYFFEHAVPQAMESTTRVIREAALQLSLLEFQQAKKRKATLMPALIRRNLEGNTALPGLVMDVSARGARLKVREAYEVGSSIVIDLPWITRKLSARIIRCEPDGLNRGSHFQLGVQIEDSDFNSNEIAGFNQVFASGAAAVRVL